MSSIRKKFGALVLLGSFGFLGLAALGAHALGTKELETFYYSDASYAVKVGWRLEQCNGIVSGHGKVTPFPLTFERPCSS